MNPNGTNRNTTAVNGTNRNTTAVNGTNQNTTAANGDVFAQEERVPHAYRYHLGEMIKPVEFEATLVLSLFAVEALHGETQTLLDARHAFDASRRVVIIDASTDVGRDWNRLFLGFLMREFGNGSFRVERLATALEYERAHTRKKPRHHATERNVTRTTANGTAQATTPATMSATQTPTTAIPTSTMISDTNHTVIA